MIKYQSDDIQEIGALVITERRYYSTCTKVSCTSVPYLLSDLGSPDPLSNQPKMRHSSFVSLHLLIDLGNEPQSSYRALYLEFLTACEASSCVKLQISGDLTSLPLHSISVIPRDQTFNVRFPKNLRAVQNGAKWK